MFSKSKINEPGPKAAEGGQPVPETAGKPASPAPAPAYGGGAPKAGREVENGSRAIGRNAARLFHQEGDGEGLIG